MVRGNLQLFVIRDDPQSIFIRNTPQLTLIWDNILSIISADLRGGQKVREGLQRERGLCVRRR